jgi:SAM-dependent methyltransferase
VRYPHEFFQRWFPDEPCPTTAFHRVLAEHVPAAGKLLDFGCGANDLLARYRNDDREVWGVDFGVHPELRHADWYRSLSADGTIPFDDATFDVVCSHMVMEHVAEPARFLREVARVLKSGGVYVGHSIHTGHYVTWIRRLFDLVPHGWVQRLVKLLYGREEHDTFPTRYRLNRPRAVGRVARQAYLEWEAWHGHANQGYFAFSPLLVRQAVLLDWSLEKVYPGLGKIYFTVVLRKPKSSIAAVSEKMGVLAA